MRAHTKLICIFIVVFGIISPDTSGQTLKSPWPKTTNTNKPWARWWWMGSAVDKPNLKKNLIDLQKAGIGGVEITPIYGVKGQENNFIDYLSPKWLELLKYTIQIADSTGIQVDMVLGTGWPYGGPQVDLPHAATKLIIEKYALKKGDKFNQEIKPDPLKEKMPAQLLHVVGYGADGSYIDLTNQVKTNVLDWTAKKTDYTLYAIFSGKTGQQVKRAAPGGKGYTLDHYSQEALNAYVAPFNTALAGFEGKIRSIFNDSYEVYDTDFTPQFFKEFEIRRGYDLKKELPNLLSKSNTEIGNRIKSDYRETLSDLLLHRFDQPWTNWAHTKNFKTRLQAHGSPGNLLDLYAAADIPECETFGSMPYDIFGLRREKQDIREGDADPVMLKFSSSAAHIAGKPLVSSETFTWLRDHFKIALSQCKPEAEDLLLNGVNHIFLHGSTYSPESAKWPGWTFYASANFNANATTWEDAPALFDYIANCQSLLQQGQSDNDTLLYWPIYDTWGQYLEGSLFFQFKIHSLGEWLKNTPFYATTQNLMKQGYGVDFISDNFIAQAKIVNGKIVLPGGSFKSLIVPPSEKMPLATLEKLIALKKAGGEIIFEGLPSTVPGYFEFENQNKKMLALLDANKEIIRPTKDLTKALTAAQVYPEKLIETGLKYVRRNINGEKLYYIVNHSSKTIDDFIPIQIGHKEVLIFDPLTKNSGNAIVEKQANITRVKVHLESGQSLFLQTENQASQSHWNYTQKIAEPLVLKGNWEVSFDKGGPQLPSKATLSQLESWTTFSPEAEAFSGTATYNLSFNAPNIKADSWNLNLGDVRESAQVWLNGTFIGTAWSNPFTLNIGQLKKGQNTLTVKVTNLGANRIRNMELNGEEWKIFYEINMVDKDYKKFDATKWNPTPSGLLGPVSITPLKKE
ncbi:MAG: hypothetical protein RLZZ44_1288 [Bacteroidota bacterium]